MLSNTDLASKVARELSRAGLPQWNLDRAPEAGGFGIDETDDVEVPLTVAWIPPRELLESASEALKEDTHHPIIRHLSQITMAMTKAMLGILESAGLYARMSDNDLSPGVVEILRE